MSDGPGPGAPPEDGGPEEQGQMLRPDFVVVPDESLVPEANTIRPAPTRFTHQLVDDEPYYFDRDVATDHPDGILPAGTPLAVLIEHDDFCRVADASGLYVDVRRSNLRPLRPTEDLPDT